MKTCKDSLNVFQYVLFYSKDKVKFTYIADKGYFCCISKAEVNKHGISQNEINRFMTTNWSGDTRW